MWPFRRKVETRSEFTLTDPLAIEILGMSPSVAGVAISESAVLGYTPAYRAVSLLSGTIGTLPLKTYRHVGDGKEPLKSFLDTPAGPYSFTPFEWKETVVARMVLHGSAPLLHRYNEGGALIGLQPLPPQCVRVEWARDPAPETDGKLYRVSMADGSQRTFTSLDLTYLMALTLDGLHGYGMLQAARAAVATGIAGDRAAARMFQNGAMVSGMVVPRDGEDFTEAEAAVVKESIRQRVLGIDNAGDIAVINRRLQFEKWSLSAEDAQFLESRAFQVEEVARFTGIPKVLLAEDGASTWGSGIAELIRGLERFTLAPWCQRIEQRLSLLLPAPRFVEFETKGLLKGSPKDEIELIILQLDKGLLTLDEARALLNRPALTPEIPATADVVAEAAALVSSNGSAP